MKVCFLSGARYTKPLDLTSEKKFRALAALGEIFVIGFSSDLRPRRFMKHARFHLLPKWPLPALRYLTMFVVAPWLVVWLVWRQGVRVLVAQSPYEGFTAACAKIIVGWFGRRVVLVLENHGDFEESLFLQRRVALPSVYRYLMQATARFAFRHADLMRAVSSSTRNQLQVWAPGRPIAQFPTWTDIDVFLEAGAQEAKQGPEILYAGVLIPRKGVHHLIGAFATVAPEFPLKRLFIIGRGDNAGYATDLKHLVNELGLNGRVTFLGEAPQAELARWMARAAVFVLPTLSEGLPRVVFEAMASGTPVVGSRVAGIPDIVQEGVNGFLVSPGDEAALAERMGWVLAHPEAARAMGHRAKAFAQSFFSTNIYINGYRHLFAMAEKIIQGKCTNHATPTV